MFAEERRILGIAASSWPGIIAPVVIGILMLTAWEAVVRIKGIPHYILPGPILIAQTLWNDWGTLSDSLLDHAAHHLRGADRRDRRSASRSRSSSRSRSGWRNRCFPMR